MVESSHLKVRDHEDLCERFSCNKDDDEPVPPLGEVEIGNITLDAQLLNITIREIISDLRVYLVVLKTGIHLNELYDSIVEAKYFSIGYHLGSGMLGIAIIFDEFMAKINQIVKDYDNAKNLAEIENQDDSETSNLPAQNENSE